MGLVVLLALVDCIIFGGLANYLGNKKNIDNAFWWGFLLGVIGLIIVAGLPTEEEKVEDAEDAEDMMPEFTWSEAKTVVVTVIVILGLCLLCQPGIYINK